MTYSWTLLAPHHPWEYTKQMQGRRLGVREDVGRSDVGQRRKTMRQDSGEGMKREERISIALKVVKGGGNGLEGASIHTGVHFLTFV